MSNLSQEGFQTLEDFNQVNQPQQDSLFDLQEYAVGSLAKVAELKSKVKAAKEMIQQMYKNDGEWISLTEEAKTAKKAVQSKEGILNQTPEIKAQKNLIKSIREDIKSSESSVSDAALQIEKISHTDTIEMNGNVYDIVKVARLVKRVQ